MVRKIPKKLKIRFEHFIHNPATSGVLLIICAAIAMLWANLDKSHSYHHFWDNTLIKIGEPDQVFYNVTLHHFVNDFLMAIFFFLTGLEIKREIKAGELSTLKKAMVPISAAIGGMVVPASIFVIFNFGQSSISGWGVPMATDIAFSLGVLAMLRTRIPLSLKVFLTALAIADDMGAVMVIAVFYTDAIDINALIAGNVGILALFVANFMGIRNRNFYYVVGLAIVWVSFMYSGVHATIAGIMVAFSVPSDTKIDTETYIRRSKKLLKRLEEAEAKEEKGIISAEKMEILLKQKELIYCAYNPLQYKEKFWHPIVNFFIMPVFALANAGVEIQGSFADLLKEPIFLGIFFGLFVGKLIGVFFFTKLAQWLKLGELAPEINNKHIAGVGLLAGIGFTMALFIANLAFFEPGQVDIAKQAILLTSFMAAISGFLLLYFAGNKK
jgi:Na+:H+ antiporter, NhaA family